MSDQPTPDWSDDRIVEYVRQWAIEHGKCGLDGFAANRINLRHVFPAGEILTARGPDSVTKLLPLLHDANRHVQLAAANLAYEADPIGCRRVLEELVKTLDVAGMLAWMLISHYEGPDAVPDPRTVWGIKD
jgi:hypothetical protein